MGIQSSPLDIVIIGGGISGCICALDLARRGHRVKVLERRSCLSIDYNELYRFHSNAVGMLMGLGLQDAFLSAGHVSSTGVRYRRYDTGEVIGTLNMDDGVHLG
jgi:2-polyprenyl-6-methoxyphenol hydroxylase-like FAD-dependent oxidoreductase